VSSSSGRVQEVRADGGRRKRPQPARPAFTPNPTPHRRPRTFMSALTSPCGVSSLRCTASSKLVPSARFALAGISASLRACGAGCGTVG
jgi:hypothetical protein